MIQVQPVRCHTLAHPDDIRQMDFYPIPEGVKVVHRNIFGKTASWDLSVEEARELWRKLLAQGYKPW